MDRVLLVDDSEDCRLLVSRALQDCYRLSIASDVAEAKRIMENQDFALLLLDVDLPDGDGFRLCSSILAQKKGLSRPRVLFLTGARDIRDRLTGFSVGGDDYVVKPFDPLELKARVAAHLRTCRETAEAARGFQVGNLTLDLEAHTLEIDGEDGIIRPDLTPTEYLLLQSLARHEGRVLSRERLLSNLSGDHLDVTDRSIDSHLSRLRKKLAGASHTVEAVYGIGYRLVPMQGH